jgi:hypothetical protein
MRSPLFSPEMVALISQLYIKPCCLHLEFLSSGNILAIIICLYPILSVLADHVAGPTFRLSDDRNN